VSRGGGGVRVAGRLLYVVAMVLGVWGFGGVGGGWFHVRFLWLRIVLLGGQLLWTVLLVLVVSSVRLRAWWWLWVGGCVLSVGCERVCS